MGWLHAALSVKEVVVYRSIATNVFTNLALEDWIFQNVDFTERRILFLWRNSPCVVIGRHQNPWLETNIPLLRERGVALARRRSGGGAVYHDLGNLNVTVFTHRHDYNRPRNLKLVCDALNEGWGSGLHANKRDDIMYKDRWKVSGSSAKLTKNSAYHHFTLLLNADRDNLHSCLRPHPNLRPSRSIATPSERSEVVNLCTLHPEMTHEAVISAIAEKFYAVHRIQENKKVVDVDPTFDKCFPGIHEMQSELEKWDWVYGKTPKFSFESFKEFSFGNLKFCAELQHGVLGSCSLELTPSSSLKDNSLDVTLQELSTALHGKRFSRREIESCCFGHSRNSEDIEVVKNWISRLT